MGKKKNQYHQKAKKRHFLSGFEDHLDTRDNIKHSAIETGKDVLGVIVGGAVGSKMNTLVAVCTGIVVAGLGHYKKNRLIQVLGIGLIAAPIITQENAAVKGLEGMDGVKEHLKAYRDVWLKKLHLNKALKKSGVATSGIGEMQFFDYQEQVNGMLASPGNDDLAALDDIENQLADSAMEFQGGFDMGETSDNLLGDSDDKLY